MTFVSISDGQILTVTADKGSYGTVWNEGSIGQWTVAAHAPLRLARPGVYRIETVRGNVTHSIDGHAVAALAETLPARTEVVRSARIITSALVEGQQAIEELKRMSLHEKFKRLAERTQTVPRALSDRADKVLGGFDRLEKHGDATLGGLEVVLSAAEAGLSVAEDALNQITNGAPVDPN